MKIGGQVINANRFEYNRLFGHEKYLALYDSRKKKDILEVLKNF